MGALFESIKMIFTNEYAMDWNTIFLFSLIAWAIIIYKMRKRSFKYLIVITLIVIYVSNVIDLTLLPLPANLKSLQEMSVYRFDPRYHLSLLPFFISLRPIHWPASIVFNLLNILMFVPMGMIIGFYKDKITWKKAAFYSFLISLSIESCQLFLAISIPSSSRIFDVDDLMMNTLGGLIGFLIFKILLLPLYFKVTGRSIYQIKE